MRYRIGNFEFDAATFAELQLLEDYVGDILAFLPASKEQTKITLSLGKTIGIIIECPADRRLETALSVPLGINSERWATLIMGRVRNYLRPTGFRMLGSSQGNSRIYWLERL